MGLSLIIRGRWSEYRVYLISETEALTPGTRWASVRGFMAPWLLLLLVGGALCVSLDLMFNLGELGRALLIGAFALVWFLGSLYTGWILLYYGVRADIRRSKEARAKGG